MDIKQLRVFSSIAEYGSFSRAAVALSVAQPALSRQIKSLEAELGIQLLYRNGRGIVLTEAGKLLDRYAKGILESVTRATSEIAALRSSPRGNVIIGMPPSVGFVLTVPLAQTPALSLDKSADVTTVDAVGDAITYTFLLTNTGDVTLFNIAVYDPMLPGVATQRLDVGCAERLLREI